MQRRKFKHWGDVIGLLVLGSIMGGVIGGIIPVQAGAPKYDVFLGKLRESDESTNGVAGGGDAGGNTMSWTNENGTAKFVNQPDDVQMVATSEVTIVGDTLVSISSSTKVKLTGGSGGIEFDGVAGDVVLMDDTDLLPENDTGGDLGLSFKRWGEIHAVEVFSSGSSMHIGDLTLSTDDGIQLLLSNTNTPADTNTVATSGSSTTYEAGSSNDFSLATVFVATPTVSNHPATKEFTEGEVTTHAGDASAHHTRYTDTEATNAAAVGGFLTSETDPIHTNFVATIFDPHTNAFALHTNDASAHHVAGGGAVTTNGVDGTNVATLFTNHVTHTALSLLSAPVLTLEHDSITPLDASARYIDGSLTLTSFTYVVQTAAGLTNKGTISFSRGVNGAAAGDGGGADVSDVTNRVRRNLFVAGALLPTATGETTNNAAKLQAANLITASNAPIGVGMVSVQVSQTNDRSYGTSFWIARADTAIRLYIFSDLADTNFCKVDIDLFASEGETAPLFTTNGLNASVASTLETFDIDRSEFGNTNYSGWADIIFTGYSFQTQAVFVVKGEALEQ